MSTRCHAAKFVSGIPRLPQVEWVSCDQLCTGTVLSVTLEKVLRSLHTVGSTLVISMTYIQQDSMNSDECMCRLFVAPSNVPMGQLDILPNTPQLWQSLG